MQEMKRTLEAIKERLGNKCPGCAKPLNGGNFVYVVTGNGLLMCERCWSLVQIAEKCGVVTRFHECEECEGDQCSQCEGTGAVPESVFC